MVIKPVLKFIVQVKNHLELMKLFPTLFLFLFSFTIGFSQYSDPNFQKPKTGYGADGTHTVGTVSFPNPSFPSKNIEVYYPSDIVGKVPTIFYNHAFGGNISSHISGMLEFVAKKGYAIVFVPYQTVGETIPERYDNLLNGFRLAARKYPNIIDTTKVGFLGHSFGGGATYGNAYKCFTENNWGQNGRFIYALAQWYSFNITQAQLQAFPANTKLLVQVYDDDVTNDHRMAVDIFKNISIPNAEKDFILMKSDTIKGYVYAADHVVPNSVAFDALDYYGYYRLLDALCDYTFNGSAAGKDVALGNGSTNQVTMPTGLKKLEETDNPLTKYSENKYQFPCSDNMNLRSNYCSSAATPTQELSEKKIFKVQPNPTTSTFSFEIPMGITAERIIVVNMTGQVILTQNIQNQTFITLDLAPFSNGLYFIMADNWRGKVVKE